MDFICCVEFLADQMIDFMDLYDSCFLYKQPRNGKYE